VKKKSLKSEIKVSFSILCVLLSYKNQKTKILDEIKKEKVSAQQLNLKKKKFRGTKILDEIK
jgi:hypothetical protein